MIDKTFLKIYRKLSNKKLMIRLVKIRLKWKNIYIYIYWRENEKLTIFQSNKYVILRKKQIKIRKY